MIPRSTIFRRDEDGYVHSVINPAAEWVFTGPRLALRLYDGVSMYKGRRWWYEQDGELLPVDPPTLWQRLATRLNYGTDLPKVEFKPFEYQTEFKEALQGNNDFDPPVTWPGGWYELVGPNIKGDPEGIKHHKLISHLSASQLGDIQVLDFHEMSAQDAFVALRNRLETMPVSGVVFYGEFDRRAQIRKDDFNYNPLTKEQYVV